MIKDEMNIGLGQYSDELANGDSADNKDIHEEEDMNDDVVDVNGQTNRGYGSKVPSVFEASNKAGNLALTQLEDTTLLQTGESHDLGEGHYWKQIQNLAQKQRHSI